MRCRTRFLLITYAVFGLFSAGDLVLAQAASPTVVDHDHLKQLFNRYQGLTELSVDFQQTKILKDVPNHLVSKGHLLVQTPDRLVWTITTPSFLEVLISKGEVQITSGKGPSADVQKVTRAQLASNPQSRSLDGLAHWLKFDSEFLEHEYEVSRLENGRYVFNPRKLEESPFIQLTVDLTKSGAVRELDLSEKSGDRLEIYFDEPKIKRAGQK
jgi:outer membrane lipoprotein-sorting protein